MGSSSLSRLLRWLDRAARLTIGTVLLAMIAAAASVGWVRSAADGYVYPESTVPAAPVALVLGAQVYPGGVPSPFLTARLAIARRLLAAGRVRAILVSGDHREWRYDEPGAMQRWLLAEGVPAEKIVLDHAGFDSYDSCARASRIFGVRRAIVVTQSYHISRAVMLCRRLGVDAVGVGDESVRRYTRPWLVSSNREHGACVKAVFDLASRRDPVFLGRHETGVEDALRTG